MTNGNCQDNQQEGLAIMKKRKLKYLLALLPLAICTVLSFAYARITPRDVTDLQNPYRTGAMLQYLSTTWVYIGLVLSLVFLSTVVIEDVFNHIQEYLDRRSIEKNERKRKAT